MRFCLSDKGVRLVLIFKRGDFCYSGRCFISPALFTENIFGHKIGYIKQTSLLGCHAVSGQLSDMITIYYYLYGDKEFSQLLKNNSCVKCNMDLI